MSLERTAVPRKLAQSGALEIPFSPCVGILRTVGMEVALLQLLPDGSLSRGTCRQPVDREFPGIFPPRNISENAHLEIIFVSICQRNSEAVGFSDSLYYGKDCVRMMWRSGGRVPF